MKENFSLVTVVTLLLAFFGVVGPIAWDYYTSESELTLAVTSSSIVISPSINIEGLEITYKGQSLDTLSKTNFTLENTGSKPILKEDIIEPVNVNFSEEIKVLDAYVESVHPENLKSKLTNSKEIIAVSFSLLNPGDRVNFSILSTDKTFDFIATTRIAGISSLTVKEFKEEAKFSSVSFIVYPVGLISALLAMVSIVGFTRYPKERNIKKAYASGEFKTPSLKNMDDWKYWIDNTFNFATKSGRERLLRSIEKQKTDTGFKVNEIHEEIGHTLNDVTNNLMMAIVVLSISLFGLHYVATSLGLV